VAVLLLPVQTTPVGAAAVDDIPETEEAHHAAAGTVFTGTVAHTHEQGAVVDAPVEPCFFGHPIPPAA
jgi:hypothetical protein